MGQSNLGRYGGDRTEGTGEEVLRRWAKENPLEQNTLQSANSLIPHATTSLPPSSPTLISAPEAPIPCPSPFLWVPVSPLSPSSSPAPAALTTGTQRTQHPPKAPHRTLTPGPGPAHVGRVDKQQSGKQVFGTRCSETCLRKNQNLCRLGCSLLHLWWCWAGLGWATESAAAPG